MCLSRFKPADWNKFLDVVIKWVAIDLWKTKTYVGALAGLAWGNSYTLNDMKTSANVTTSKF